jgi:RND family efflux transporter MFP subunit
VELYDHQLPWLNENEPATVTFDHLPGATITAQIHTVQPEVSPETRTVQLTLDVPNPENRLKVGMYGTVRFEPIAARDALAIPSQAVIRTGERNIVVVALGDGRFQPKEVSLGVESDGFVQIVDGVTADDRIVTSAQFMIDSESNLRAAVQRMVAERSARSHQH